MRKLSLRILGKFATLILTTVLCVGAALTPQKDAQAVPICIDDLCIEVPTTVDHNWTVRAADFDSNGLTDLYVRGGYMTFAEPFLILQTAVRQFALAVPTQQHRDTARTLPDSSISVYREELNNDTFLDFWIENVDEVIPGVQELIVLTKFDDGTKADKVLPVLPDGPLDVLIDNIEFVLNNAKEMIDLYNGQTCFIRTVYIPYQVWDPYYDMYVLRWMPVSWQECYPNRDHPIFSGDLGVFCGGMSTSFAANGGEAGSRQAAVQAARTGQVILDHTIRPAVERGTGQAVSATLARVLARQAAKRAAIMLVLGASTGGVGLVIAVAWTAYDLWVFYKETSAARAQAQRKKRDALVAVATVPAATYNPATDPYRMKENCKPWDNVAAQEVGTGSADILRRNLKRSGCECPPGTQAHHMFKKKGGEGAGDRLRACLAGAGINIDAAGNGICLPTNEQDPFIKEGRTRIASHQGAGLERYEYYSGLAKECEDRTRNLTTEAQKKAAVRQLLDELRHSLHNWRILQ